MKILIAEDDKTSVILLEALLTPYGFLIHKAENGSEAIEMYKKEFHDDAPYGLIFMDIMMPGVDGLEALLKIREFEIQNSVPPENEVKVIMTTAINDKKTILKAILRGRIIGYLTKPIETEKFKKLIHEHCQN